MWEKINCSRNFSMAHLVEYQITPLILKCNKTAFSTLKFLFHALEWANCCSKVAEKCAFSRNYAFQDFCKIPWISPKNLNILWIQREIEGYSKFQLFANLKLKKCEGEALTYFHLQICKILNFEKPLFSLWIRRCF